MSEDQEPDDLREILKELTGENVALRMVCSLLMSEVALLSDSPRDKLARMVATFQGVMHASVVQARSLDEGTDNLSKFSSESTDAVCSTAEAFLRAALIPGQRSD